MATTAPAATPASNQDTLYDVAIIGSGPAGYTAAIRGGQLGLKVALIEAMSSAACLRYPRFRQLKSRPCGSTPSAIDDF